MKQIGKERARGESMQAGWRIEPSSVQIRVVSSANKGPAAIQNSIIKKIPGGSESSHIQRKLSAENLMHLTRAGQANGLVSR